MTQILLLAQVRLLCHQRRWDLLPPALSELGTTLGWTEAGFSWTLASCKNADWLAPIAVQFLLYQCLWEGRQGRPERVKVLRKEAFGMMDQASECRAFDVLRRNGGLVDVSFTESSKADDRYPSCMMATPGTLLSRPLHQISSTSSPTMLHSSLTTTSRESRPKRKRWSTRTRCAKARPYPGQKTCGISDVRKLPLISLIYSRFTPWSGRCYLTATAGYPYSRWSHARTSLRFDLPQCL